MINPINNIKDDLVNKMFQVIKRSLVQEIILIPKLKNYLSKYFINKLVNFKNYLSKVLFF